MTIHLHNYVKKKPKKKTRDISQHTGSEGKIGLRVFRKDDPRHIGVIKSVESGFAIVKWEDSGWTEKVFLGKLEKEAGQSGGSTRLWEPPPRPQTIVESPKRQLERYFAEQRKKQGHDQEEPSGPFVEGYGQARLEERTENPYLYGTEEWAQWGAGFAAGSTTDDRTPTMTKQQANYVPDAPLGKKHRQCQDCDMFHTTGMKQTGHGTCGLVIGPISPPGTCDHFDRRDYTGG